MIAAVAAPSVVEKSNSPATIAAMATGGDIATSCASIPSSKKKPLSLPKKKTITVRLFPGIWMVIFIGDDALQANGTDKASMIDIRAAIAIALRRNVSGYAKDILDLRLPLRGFISFIAAPPCSALT